MKDVVITMAKVKLVKLIGHEKQKEYSKILIDKLEMLYLNNIYMIYAENIKEPVGAVDCRITDNNNAHIDYIYVFEEYRFNGIGREVIKILLQSYDLHGWSVPTALQFWKKVGAQFKKKIETEEDLKHYLETDEYLEFILN